MTKWTDSSRYTKDERHNAITEEITFIINTSLKKKSGGPDGFIGLFYQTFKEELIPVLHKLFRKIKEKRMFPSLFYEANITLIPKPVKDMKRKNKTKQKKPKAQ